MYRHLEVVKYLLEKGADPNASCLECALAFFSGGGREKDESAIEIDKLLLSKGARVDDIYGQEKTTALIEMCRNLTGLSGSKQNAETPRRKDYMLQIVDLLLSNGATVNCCDRCGITPLHYAANSGYTDLVERLFSRGAEKSINAKMITKETPLTLALREITNREKDKERLEQRVQMVYMLVDKGARFDEANIPNESGYTPLHFAAITGVSRIVKDLLEKGNVNVNQKSNEGYTALDYAQACGHADIVDLLVRHGAQK